MISGKSEAFGKKRNDGFIRNDPKALIRGQLRGAFWKIREKCADHLKTRTTPVHLVLYLVEYVGGEHAVHATQSSFHTQPDQTREKP